jgi:hypothetical protein
MRSEEYFVDALKNLNTRDEICVLQCRISLFFSACHAHGIARRVPRNTSRFH